MKNKYLGINFKINVPSQSDRIRVGWRFGGMGQDGCLCEEEVFLPWENQGMDTRKKGM